MSQGKKQPHGVRWVVPLRRVFPWWYLGGLVTTYVLLALLSSGSTSGSGALWGPIIGLEIQRRQNEAARRQGEGLPVQRRDLAGPRWFEPVLTVLFTLIAAGVSLTLGFIFGGPTLAERWVGVALLLTGIMGVTGLALRARRRRRRDVPVAR